MAFLGWLFGGSLAAKALLILAAVLTAGAGYALLRRSWQRQGFREAIDQVRKESDDARRRMDKAAGDFERDGAGKRLRDGTY